MASKGYISYKQPKEKFIMISNKVIDNFDADVVGVYCKIVKLPAGKSLSIDFISKKIGVSEVKVRKIIVLLEKEGYIVREAIRNEKGYINSWNYCLYAEPVPNSQRSHAGKKNKKDESYLYENQQVGNPTCRESNMLENEGVNILSNTDVLSNKEDLDLDNNKKVLSDDNTKNAPLSKLSDEEKAFEEKMKQRFPRIMKMEQPLTIEQAKKLKEKYDGDLLLKIMNDMENYKPLIHKSVSAYKTIINWCNRELDRV